MPRRSRAYYCIHEEIVGEADQMYCGWRMKLFGFNSSRGGAVLIRHVRYVIEIIVGCVWHHPA